MARIAAVLTLLLLTAGLGAPAASAAPPSGYVPKSALILGDSVTPQIASGDDVISLEQYAAQRAGYTVTVVTGDQWSALTATEFARYQVLIIGDPDCGPIPGSALANASVWTKVVMGTSGANSTVGNRTLIGTDPAFHFTSGAAPSDPADPSTAGAERLVQAGITYAGGVAGATGAYFDTSCSDPGGAVSVLNSLSSTGTGFTESSTPPCGGDVAIIASNPAFAGVSYTDIQGWSCSVHTTYPTYPTDWQPLAVATDTDTKPTCGINSKDGTTACGESYILVAGRGLVAAAPDLALTPTVSSGAAGGSHTVTATVTSSGSPASGQLVTFTVTGQNAGVTGVCVPSSCLTNGSGQVTFTYPDTNGVGTDTINAAITVDGSTQQATASRTWTLVNHAPTADSKSVTTAQGTAVGVTLSGSDSDGDALTYAVVTSPAHGTLTGSGASRTYTPAAGFSGADSFTYKVNDGTVDSAVATVSITVTAVPTGCPTAAPVIDGTVSAKQSSPSSTFTAPAVNVATGGHLLLAFVQADGPGAPTQKVTGVTGGGLTWKLAVRSNSTWGTSEVWQANAPSALTSVVVRAKLAYAYDGSIVVVSAKGAASTVGAVAAGAGISRTPTAVLKTTRCNSLVYASGHDWTSAFTVTPRTGQSLLHSFIDTRVHDTFWVQKVNSPVTTSGSSVTVGDTLTKSDRWTLAAVEIRAL